jgi:hypothetical protein
MEDEKSEEKYERHKSIPRRYIPILPKRAAPSNIRSRSNKLIDGDRDEPFCGGAINQYEIARHRSRQSSKE